MSDKFITMTSELHDYVERRSVRLDSVMERLVEETAALGDLAQMQIAPDHGAFLTLLVRAVGARAAVEVGTFTGYSAISIARGLPDDGRLLCCDVSEEWTAIARRYFRETGMDRKIELRIAPALETLCALPAVAQFDFAFVDADKTSYAAYYEEILTRLCPGGLLAIDNVLWSGKVIDSKDQSESTRAIRALNDHVAVDDRVDAVILPIADGLTLARKR
jgi:predicted O-methyltransferase YrrM